MGDLPLKPRRMYRPGDWLVCCEECRHVFGTWPREAGDPPLRVTMMRLYCPRRQCKAERRIVFREPDLDRIAA